MKDYNYEPALTLAWARKAKLHQKNIKNLQKYRFSKIDAEHLIWYY